MTLTCSTFHQPKLGNEPDEYEDAYWAASATGARRFAVADGATESSYSGHWARLLVEVYGRGHTSPSAFAWHLERARQRWQEARAGLELPWYAEQKLAQGASATFLGVTIRESLPVSYRCLAAGDSVLIHVRAGRVHCSFPVLRSSDFGSSPVLLSTRLDGRASRRRLVVRTERLVVGPEPDRLLLATDAIGAWVLREAEAERDPVSEIERVLTDGSLGFKEWVDGVRSDGSMRNDDVTLQVLGFM